MFCSISFIKCRKNIIVMFFHSFELIKSLSVKFLNSKLFISFVRTMNMYIEIQILSKNKTEYMHSVMTDLPENKQCNMLILYNFIKVIIDLILVLKRYFCKSHKVATYMGKINNLLVFKSRSYICTLLSNSTQYSREF